MIEVSCKIFMQATHPLHISVKKKKESVLTVHLASQTPARRLIPVVVTLRDRAGESEATLRDMPLGS